VVLLVQLSSGSGRSTVPVPFPLSASIRVGRGWAKGAAWQGRWGRPLGQIFPGLAGARLHLHEPEQQTLRAGPDPGLPVISMLSTVACLRRDRHLGSPVTPIADDQHFPMVLVLGRTNRGVTPPRPDSYGGSAVDAAHTARVTEWSDAKNGCGGW
jgi:hypothetical protein